MWAYPSTIAHHSLTGLRFSKMNWLNIHHNYCSKYLAKNTFETILIGDSIVAGLSRYQHVWEKFLKPPKALNCGVGGKIIQHVLWHVLSLPVFSHLKNVVLCGNNNLPLDSPKDITDGILEIARLFKTNYSCVNATICGILSCDDS